VPGTRTVAAEAQRVEIMRRTSLRRTETLASRKTDEAKNKGRLYSDVMREATYSYCVITMGEMAVCAARCSTDIGRGFWQGRR
jgi:hypothetical protein